MGIDDSDEDGGEEDGGEDDDDDVDAPKKFTKISPLTFPEVRTLKV